MSSTLRAFLIWLLPGIVVAVAVARVSVWIQPHFSPLVLFPLLIGAALGALLCGLIQITNLRDLRLVLAGTVLVVLLAAAAEHVFFYLDRRAEHLRKALEAGIPEEVLSRPTFAEYMRQQAELDDMKVPLWIGNAVLMAVAAGGMVIWYSRFRDAAAGADHLQAKA
ncbi:MAG: hypothetical protein WD894_25990 [Pirellulales bacterium]